MYSDYLFNGWDFENEPFMWFEPRRGDTLVFQFYQVTAEYHEYIGGLNNLLQEFDPFFSTLPAPSKSNISNRGQGFFPSGTGL